MRAIPAIDLREGACVQLVGGSYEAERVRVNDPLDALRRWRQLPLTVEEFRAIETNTAPFLRSQPSVRP